MSSDPYSPVTTQQRLPRPFNGVIYNTTFQVSAEKPLPQIGDTMESELGIEFENSIIISSQKGQERAPFDQLILSHAQIPSEVDQLNTNWEATNINVAGNQYKAVVRTVIIKDEDYSTEVPIYGSAMPIGSNGLFQNEEYILYEKACLDSGVSLEPIFRVERRTYVKRSRIKMLGADPMNGKMLSASSYLYYKDEEVTGSSTIQSLMDEPSNDFWGTQLDATQVKGRQLSDDWYEVTTEMITSGTIISNELVIQKYLTSYAYYWPPVLESIQVIDFIYDNKSNSYATPRYSKEEYRGECLAEYTITFHKSPPQIQQPTRLQPLPISISYPGGSVNISSCLHPSVIIQLIWRNISVPYSFAQTNPADWPDFVIIENVQPAKAGYIKTSVKVFRPGTVSSGLSGNLIG
jgi:hypothetical protein